MTSRSVVACGRRILALTLFGSLTTCSEVRSPTSLGPEGPAVAQLTGGIGHTVLTSGNNAVNQRIYTTASIAPAPNALITVAVLGRQSTGAGPSPVLSGGGMTAWTEVATVTFDPLGLPTRRLTIYRAMSATPGSGPLTITWSGTSLGNCQWIVSQWTGVDQSGVNGAGAIGLTGTNRGDAVTGLTVALGALGNAANVAYGAFGVTSTAAVVTPGAGFTEIAELPSGESTPGDLEAEWATNLTPIAATWTSRNAGAVGVEIKAAATGGPGGVSGTLSTVAAAPTPITAGSGSSTITVTVKDASGNPISGATVAISATGTGNTVTQPAGPTDNAGVATGTLSSTVAESKTVSATANGTAITQTAAVTVAPGPVSASQSTVTADPTSIGPGGTSTITVRALDANGNPISGATVVLAATGSGSAVTQPATPTNSSGVATGTVSGAVEENVVVSATIAGVPVSQTATVQVKTQASVTIAHTVLTSGNNAVNQRIYTTASIAPAPNALITVAVLGRQSSGASPSPTVSGGGMTTWTEVATVTFDPLSLPTRRVTIYRAMSAAPGSGPLTITFTGTQGNCQWIVSQWTGVDQSGVNGAGAIGQTGATRSDAVSSLTVPLGVFGNAANVAYGAFGVTSKVAVVTPGAGFTEIAELPSGESTPGDLEAEWATNDNTIDAGWGTSKNGAALGVEIKAGGTPGPTSLDLTVDRIYVTQATQTLGNAVPLVASKPGLVRVFVRANQNAVAVPEVRVDFYNGGALVSSTAVPGTRPAPVAINEGDLSTSWNLSVPGSLIQAGTSIVAEVDPTHVITEADETNNLLTYSETVQSTALQGYRFVPVKQTGSGLTGDVNVSNAATYDDLAMRIYPIRQPSLDVHQTYTTSTPVENGNGNAWDQILSEIDAVRVAEGSAMTYVGVVKVTYTVGIVGVGYIGRPTAVVVDEPVWRGVNVAHELGHTYGRDHAPGCGAGSPDRNYPYAGGTIGVFGTDVFANPAVLYSPSTHDIMGYCGDNWISDYTYKGVLSFLAQAPGAQALAPSPVQRSILIWGSIQNGDLRLEPAFVLDAHPVQPGHTGTYQVQGVDQEGRVLFSQWFEPTPVADDRGGQNSHFAFALPLPDSDQHRLVALRLVGQGRQFVRTTTAGAAQAVAPAAPRGLVESWRAQEAAITWDTAAAPLVMIRDTGTGQVLSIGRGGRVAVATTASSLDVLLSNGVGSTLQRVIR